MANSLGQLIVRLGLDASDFVSGLTKSEAKAQRFGASLSNKIAVGVVKGTVALEAFKAAAEFAVNAIPDLIDKAGNFQDLAEKTGASAEVLASFAVAAGTTKTEMEKVAAASVKLSVGITKVNDESTGAGAALKAIGIPLKEFKALDPGAQMEAVAKALAGFEDGAGKTAVAVALFGKAGADMLPFLKEMADGVGRVNILTADQIKRADEFADRMARSKAELSLYAQAMATEAIPALNALAEAAKEAIKEILGLDGSSKDLKASGAILDFAETAAIGLGTLLEAAVGVVKGLRAIGGSIQSVYADAKLLTSLTPAGALRNMIEGESLGSLLEKRNQAAKDANDRYVDLWNYDGTKITDAIKRSFDAQRRLLDPENAREDARFRNRAASMRGPQQKINTAGLVTGADSDAAAVLKKNLDGQIKAIRDFAEQQKEGFEFANNYLRGVYEDGLTSQADFFQKQKALRDAALQSQLAAIDSEIAAQEAYRSKALKPQERLDAENKIAEALARRAAAQQRASQQTILAVREDERAFKQLAYSYYDFLAGVKSLQGDTAGASALRIAKQTRDAQELLTNVGFDPTQAQAQADAYGKLLTQTEELARVRSEYSRLVDAASTKEHAAVLDAQLSGQSEIDTLKQIGGIRQEALAGLSAMAVKANELAAALGTPEARDYADKLALQFRQAAAEAEPLLQKVRDIGREMGEGIAGRFEEALLAKGKTMRERVLGLFNGITDDITRTLTKNLITKPLSDYLTNLIGGNGTASGGGGLLAGLFGLGKGSATNTPQEAFRSSEILAQNAATTTLTASFTAGTTAMAALTTAASSAAAALSTIAATSVTGGGGTGGLFGFLGGSAQAAFSQTSLGSSGFGTGLAYGNLDIGGFLATGGPALPGTNYRVNEQGPELLDVNGKQFLMMGNQRGRVTPLSKGGGGDTYYVNVQATPGITREQAMNQGREIQRGMQLHAGRRARNN